MCGALIVLGACREQPPSDQPDGSGTIDAREAARRDAERMIKDVQVETLTKRVADLEAEFERYRGQQAGAATIELEQRLTRLEAAMEQKRQAQSEPASPAKPRASPAKPDVAAAPRKAAPAAAAD